MRDISYSFGQNCQPTNEWTSNGQIRYDTIIAHCELLNYTI